MDPVPFELYLIEILHQTTTLLIVGRPGKALYLIEILHQTTTLDMLIMRMICCILSKFYIKPQPSAFDRVFRLGCILSKFYIKPQHPAMAGDLLKVVSYRNSTSNHNGERLGKYISQLYLIEILHQTTTMRVVELRASVLYLIEILHQTTTAKLNVIVVSQLYLIEILHQTTTMYPICGTSSWLYLIEILHQTTTSWASCS